MSASRGFADSPEMTVTMRVGAREGAPEVLDMSGSMSGSRGWPADSVPRSLDHAEDTLNSGVRAHDLPAQELDGGHSLLGRPGQPVLQRRSAAPLFLERRLRQSALNPEFHTVRRMQPIAFARTRRTGALRSDIYHRNTPPPH